MVDWRYHLGVFLSLSALSFFQPVGFETFLCSSLGFPLEHKCTESTFYRRQASKQLWSNNCWHAGEGTVCVCVCVCACAPVPFYFPIMYISVCIWVIVCFVCLLVSLCLRASVHVCVLTPSASNVCMSCWNLYAWIWLCAGLCVCVCVCVCVCSRCIGMCGVRKVNIIFKVCLTLLCAVSLSDLRTLPVYLARQLAVWVNARLTFPMPFNKPLLGLRGRGLWHIWVTLQLSSFFSTY